MVSLVRGIPPDTSPTPSHTAPHTDRPSISGFFKCPSQDAPHRLPPRPMTEDRYVEVRGLRYVRHRPRPHARGGGFWNPNGPPSVEAVWRGGGGVAPPHWGPFTKSCTVPSRPLLDFVVQGLRGPARGVPPQPSLSCDTRRGLMTDFMWCFFVAATVVDNVVDDPPNILNILIMNIFVVPCGFFNDVVSFKPMLFSIPDSCRAELADGRPTVNRNLLTLLEFFDYHI